MPWVNEDINAYVNRLVRGEIYSRQVVTRPLFYFITRGYTHNLQHLIGVNRKDPLANFKEGVMLGGRQGLARKMQTLGSTTHEFRYQKDDPDGGTNVEPGGPTPTASVFSEDLVGTAATAWTLKMWPLRVRQASIDAAQGKSAIATKALAEEAVDFSFNKAFDNRQKDFWNNTLSLAEQNKYEWSDGMIGLRHWVDDGTTSAYQYVGRVDRTAGTGVKLKANVFTAANLVANGQLPTTKPNLSLIRKLRTSNNLAGGTNTGIANLDATAGDLCITTPDLWNVLADEADDQHIIHDLATASVPQLGKSIGFKLPVIVKDNTFITYDPDCPEGEMYLLTSNTWCYEVMPGYNYAIWDWQDKAKTEEGGDHYQWTQIVVKDRFTCERPWLQVKVTGLTNN